MASHLSRIRTIAAQPQAIWDVLADFGAISSWVDGVDHSSVLERAHSPGEIGTARRIQVGRNTLVERITVFTPPTELAYDIQGLPTWLGRLANRWSLKQRTTGGTVVTLTSTVDIGSHRIQTIIERVTCRMLARQSDAMLAGLADRVENRGG